MDKKKLILTIITVILFIIVFFITYLLFNKYVLKKNFEEDILLFANKNQNTIFKVDKILFFSNADSQNKNATASNFTIENLYQYTDIALFIDGGNEEKTLENTFKSVRIENIKWNKLPELRKSQIIFQKY